MDEGKRARLNDLIARRVALRWNVLGSVYLAAEGRLDTLITPEDVARELKADGDWVEDAFDALVEQGHLARATGAVLGFKLTPAGMLAAEGHFSRAPV